MNAKNPTGRNLTEYVPLMHFPGDEPLMDEAKVRAMLDEEPYRGSADWLLVWKIVGYAVLLILGIICAWSFGIALR